MIAYNTDRVTRNENLLEPIFMLSIPLLFDEMVNCMLITGFLRLEALHVHSQYHFYALNYFTFDEMIKATS